MNELSAVSHTNQPNSCQIVPEKHAESELVGNLQIWWRGVCINSENHLDQSDVILHTERVKLL